MLSRTQLCERWCLTLVGILSALITGGCQSVRSLSDARSVSEAAVPCFVEWPSDGSAGQLAHQFHDLACDAAANGDPAACDYFYQAAVLSWPCLRSGDGVYLNAADAWRLYHASVAGLLVEAKRAGRVKHGRLLVYRPGEAMVVPFACPGLPWMTSDISDLVIAEKRTDSKLANYHTSGGFGVPVVGISERPHTTAEIKKYFAKRIPFAATAVLRPPTEHGGADEAVLELYDPLEVQTVQVDGEALTMARDISAPFDYQLRTTERIAMLGFIEPDLPPELEGLRFVEPYQPGKIPVIFVHGLLSDPTTWFSTANDLREMAWFNERYQIWAFRYASGKPFVTSAMYLRQQLQEAVVALDPECRDPALRRMVLIGHSMGGLIAKLQVTESGEQIWNSFASVPLESLHAPGEVRANLAERCFFRPQPFVKRVIFVATPHGGSSFATRGIGRVAASLVRPGQETEGMHEELVAANPDAFSPQFERRVPTSIDMLEPDDPTLLAIRSMRVSSRVRLHSIIGTGREMLTEGRGDGAVTVASALHPDVVSQRFVDSTHTEIQRHPDTQAELRAILITHLTECDRAARD